MTIEWVFGLLLYQIILYWVFFSDTDSGKGLYRLWKDAARYRWLRECSPFRSDRCIYVIMHQYKDGEYQDTYYPNLDRLDAFIDMARKERR